MACRGAVMWRKATCGFRAHSSRSTPRAPTRRKSSWLRFGRTELRPSGTRFFVHPEVAITLVTGFEELVALERAKIVEVFLQRVLQRRRCLGRIVVRAA